MFYFIALVCYLLQIAFSFNPEAIFNLKRQDGQDWTPEEGCGACNAAAGILTNSCGNAPTDPTQYQTFFSCVCGLDDTFFDVFEQCTKHCPQYPYHQPDANATLIREGFCSRAQEWSGGNATTTLSLPASGLELFGVTTPPTPQNTTLPPQNFTTELNTTITIIVPNATVTNTSPIAIITPTAVPASGWNLNFPSSIILYLLALL
ncbi:unnamed protein product [Candida verbasci]|uniref:Uncharacterized protein n=1 Tax=Candida verbasci TaxID=1227364 RepID=A0A9W4XIK1_9ASCO|nr:unnamed protein product [Candida verbasci]